MLSTIRNLAAALVCLTLCFLSGCNGPTEATVAGTVTLDDAGIGPGLITFHPQGGGAMAYSQFDSAGNYSLKSGSTKGLPAGEYVVTIAAYGDDSGVENQQIKVTPKTRPKLTATPEIYAAPETTPLKVEVELGHNVIPFPLTSDPQPAE